MFSWAPIEEVAKLFAAIFVTHGAGDRDAAGRRAGPLGGLLALVDGAGGQPARRPISG